MSESERLAGFAASLQLGDAPPEVVDKIRTNLLHNLGMLRAGSRAGTSGPGLAAAAPYDGPDAATVLHDRSRTHRDRAVVANAAMLHASARDDTHLPGITHLAVTSLPALLAVGEAHGSAGAEFMTALLAAYEVGSAVGVDVGPLASGRGFRPSSVLGAIAAGVGVGRLLGLDAAGLTSTIGLAAAFGGGTGQTWISGTDEWQYQVGVAGRNGLLAAELAAAGARGSHDALDGASGLYVALTGTRTPHAEPTELGRHWRILEVTYKPYPICAINQMPVTVLVAMAGHFGFTADEIGAMRLWLSPLEAAYPGTDTHGPFSGASGSLMSAPFCLAAAARRGTVTWADLEAVDDPDTLTLTQRIEVVPDPALRAGQCRIVVSTARGDHDSATLPAPAPFDWSFDEVHRRLVDLGSERGLTDSGLDQLVATILDLENRPVTDLVDAVSRH